MGDAKALQKKFSDFFGGNQTIVRGQAPKSVLENASRTPFSDIPNRTAITVPKADLPAIRPMVVMGGRLLEVSNPILGEVKLKPVATSVPEEGLAVPKLRVELSEKENPDSAWIAEINVLGDLPWYMGEERRVRLRVMSDEFKNHIVLNKPDLLVRRGNETIGSLELEKQ